tara:strand:- start:2417 stop:2638 length:222 start_codon:yes stop_codon:yes gene_type:complete
MKNENEHILKKKVDYFCKNNSKVHIKFKKGYWKRGYIQETSSDFFILDETLEGKMPVFYIEILSIEIYSGVKK